MGKLSILVNDRLGSHVFYKLSDFALRVLWSIAL